ncbi:MAG: metalloregulator ArsR/SmtB family transcription factor [Spirochaetales bacterium]|nr:metalloregulator ArsR/SmtB family transcription factor [Spirochaetales bacterium]
MAVVKLLRALADEARLRIVLVLRERPLAVQELMAVVGMGQSRVSRHLRILAEAGVASSLRDGTRIYYGLALEQSPVLRAFLSALDFEKAEDLPAEHIGDLVRLDEKLRDVRKQIQEHFSLSGAGLGDYQHGLVDSQLYRQWMLSVLPDAAGTVADIGCGTGVLTAQLPGRARKIIGVDQNADQLRQARLRCPQADFRPGELENLPLPNGSVDCVLAGMVLHHVPAPELALAEIRRVLRPGGQLILADLGKHQMEIMRERFADYWLGFEESRLRELLVQQGFFIERIENRRGEGELELILVSARLSGGPDPEERTVIKYKKNKEKV